MVNFGLDIFVLFFILASQWIVAPEFLQVLGRAHPMVLHFPIVLIFLLPFIPWLLTSISVSKKETAKYVGHYIVLAHFLGALTVLFGLILSLETGYIGESVTYHKWGGIILLASLALLENFWRYPSIPQRRTRLFLFFPMIALLVTSHIGAGITHGVDFLTEPILKKKVKKVPLEEAVVYRDVVHPILDQKCMSCHNTNKAKGELILMDSATILRGGEDGDVLVRGNSEDSPIVQRLLLDIDHDDHMPPKGKPQLSNTELELIREWVNHDNLFQVQYAELTSQDTLASLVKDHYEMESEPVYDMKAADGAVIQSMNDDYRLLKPIAQESPALYARFLSAPHFEMEHLKALNEVSEQVVDLHLAYLPIEDDDLSLLENFKNLQVLNLNGTRITDVSLKYLYALKDLQKLYLTGTSVSESGVRDLLKVNPIKKVYLWDTGIDSTMIKNLRTEYSSTQFVGQSNPFKDQIISLNTPKVKPENPFFEEPIQVTVEHPIPNVDIRYTLDGTKPDSTMSPLYTEPLEVNESVNLQLQAFKNGWKSSFIVHRSFYQTRFLPDTAWFDVSPNKKYPGKGASTLTDLAAGERDFNDDSYVAYREKDGVMTFDFGKSVDLSAVVISTLLNTGSYIFPPQKIEVNVLNSQGKWVKAGQAIPEQPEYEIGYKKQYWTVPLSTNIKTNRIRVTLTPLPALPAWHPGKGEKAWVFLDEVLFQ